MGQQSEYGLAGCLCLKASHEAAIKLSAKAVVLSEGSAGEISASQLSSLCVSWEDLVSHGLVTRSLPHFLLYGLSIGQLTPGHMTFIRVRK